MDFDRFQNIPFIQSIANNNRWTVSNNEKRPTDMVALRDRHILIGASFKDGNQPLVTLSELVSILPNAANTAYNLKQTLDDFVVLDIEPKCPADVRNELLLLPYKYCELSMSGHGYHLVFDKPKTQHMDILMAKPTIKHERGWYEFLLNHYVTFTGNILIPADGVTMKPIEEYYKVFDDLASKAVIQKTQQIDTSDLPELEDIPMFDEIVSLLKQAKFPKTLKDYPDESHPDKEGDASDYEFGMCGFYNGKLKLLLDTTKYKKAHEYTLQERIVLLHAIVSEIAPYREKHDTVRDGLPWLMFNCKRVIMMQKQ